MDEFHKKCVSDAVIFLTLLLDGMKPAEAASQMGEMEISLESAFMGMATISLVSLDTTAILMNKTPEELLQLLASRAVSDG